MRELTNDEIESLLQPNTDPIIWYDIEMRCASRGCGSPTYHRLRGVPYCMIHTLMICNTLLNEYETKLQKVA